MKYYGSFQTFANAYGTMLRDIYFHPENVNSPRNQKVHEVQDACFSITDVTHNMFDNYNRKFPTRYLAGELLWYFSGRNDLKFIKEYSKFWEPLANMDGTCNSAYGHLLFKEQNEHNKTEWQWARERLIIDQDSRQALIRFNKPRFSYDSCVDFVCTLNGIFTIRDNKLNLSIMMRSSDIWYGITYDVPFFTILMQTMRLQLLEKYPDLKLGTYTHHSVSLHMYERNFKAIESACNESFCTLSTPVVLESPIGIKGAPHNDIMRMSEFSSKPISTDAFLNWIYINAFKKEN